MGGVVSDILGGPDTDSSALKDFEPIGIQAGGLTGQLTRLPGKEVTRTLPSFGGGGPKGRRGSRTITETTQGPQVIDITASDERQGLITNLRSSLRSQADEVAALRDEALSGLGFLEEARLGRLRSARDRTVGNLRENLSRRRVLGSSFGQDLISRTQAEFGKQEAEASARSKLEELDIKSRLIDREFGLRQKAVQAGINELNLQAKLAASLATGATDALQASAQAQAAIASEQASGLGELIGTGLGIAFSERSLKENIVHIGERSGLPIYSFNYIWDSVNRIGHMADEVEKLYPEAVFRVGKYRAVDYGMI